MATTAGYPFHRDIGKIICLVEFLLAITFLILPHPVLAVICVLGFAGDAMYFCMNPLDEKAG